MAVSFSFKVGQQAEAAEWSNWGVADEVNSWRSREKDADVGCLLLQKPANTLKNMATASEMTSPRTHSCDREWERQEESKRDAIHQQSFTRRTDKHKINITYVTGCHNSKSCSSKNGSSAGKTKEISLTLMRVYLICFQVSLLFAVLIKCMKTSGCRSCSVDISLFLQ